MRIPLAYVPDENGNNLKIYVKTNKLTDDYDADIIVVNEKKKVLRYNLKVSKDIIVNPERKA